MTRLLLLALAVGMTLTGCGLLVVPPQAAFSLPEAARQYKVLKDRVLPPEPQLPNDQRLVKLGATALANGDLNRAEINLDSALVINPYNSHALFYLGVVYQRTSRFMEARTLYTRLIALNSVESAIVDTNEAKLGERLVHVARMNLIEIGQAYLPDAAPPPEPEEAERAIASRFATLMRLRDQKLITKQEYKMRRRANLGALLPMTEPPPAPTLEQPAPRAADIIIRLDAISRFKDAGSLSESEYAAERAAILDALLPARSRDLASIEAPPKPPGNPKPHLDRLGRLFAMKLITADEQNRERAALVTRAAPAARKAIADAPKQAMAAKPSDTAAKPAARPTMAAPPPPATAKPDAPAQTTVRAQKKQKSQPTANTNGATPAGTATSAEAKDGAIGVHIASFRTPERAKRSWNDLRKTHGDVLASLDSRIERVEIDNNGVFFQLRAGPVGDAVAAKKLCGELKRRKLYCAPTVF